MRLEDLLYIISYVKIGVLIGTGPHDTNNYRNTTIGTKINVRLGIFLQIKNQYDSVKLNSKF